MKLSFQTTLNPLQGVAVIGLLIIGVLVVFFLLPAVPRTADRNAGRLVAQARVIASFGSSTFRSGGAFYRFSAYEQRLVVCFVTAQSYSYSDVRLIQEKNVQSGKLTVDIHGTRVVLLGSAVSLGRLATALSERIANV
jgi:hypothetical protein